MDEKSDKSFSELKDIVKLLHRLLEESRPFALEDKKRLREEVEACGAVFLSFFEEARVHFHQRRDEDAWGDLEDKAACEDLLSATRAYLRCYDDFASDGSEAEKLMHVEDAFNHLPEKMQLWVLTPLLDLLKNMARAITKVRVNPFLFDKRPTFFHAKSAGDRPIEAEEKKTGEDDMPSKKER